MNDYEAQRLENLKHKQNLLAELNLNSKPIAKTVKSDPNSKQPTKKRKLAFEDAPSRTSARIASSGAKPLYTEDAGKKDNYTKRKLGKKRASDDVNQAVTAREGVETDVHSLIPAKDVEELRAGWTRWAPSARLPIRDENNVFHFEDHPTFTPNKSPEEVIKEGSFGGSYWRRLMSRKLGILVELDWRELPTSWYDGIEVDTYMTSARYNAEANKFKVACGQSIEKWEAAGWINHEHDIRGWFQWYCRFYQGRRCEDDERQVSRWRKCVGERGRWRRMLLKKYMALNVREVFDDGDDEDTQEVSPVIHQTCHHWAFEVRQDMLDEFWRTGGR